MAVLSNFEIIFRTAVEVTQASSVFSLSPVTDLNLARISHQDHGSRRRIRVRKHRSGVKSVAIATV